MSITAQVAGTGVDAQGGVVTLNHTRHIQRPALLLANGNVYAGFGSCGPDPPPFHGWIVGYSASNVQSQTAIFNATPNGEEGGIWQSGRGLVGDNQGSIYFMTGNGTFDGQYDFGSTVHKINASGALVDWFTPSDWSDLNNYDLDLASSGPILLPNANVLVGGGKEGVVYVLNPNALGQQGAPQQSFPATALCSPLSANGCQQIHGIAYWESASNPLLYVWGSSDTLRAYRWAGAQFNTVPDSTNPLVAKKPGGVMAVSSNGDNPGTGILWAITRTPT